MDLQEIRRQLDGIDAQIVSLYQQRMRLCAEVAEYKMQTGKPVFDPTREQEKLEAVAALLPGDFDKQAIRELYQQLMTISRRLQLSMLAAAGKPWEGGFRSVESLPTAGCRVVYQGVEGAYAHLAARRYFAAEAKFECVPSWRSAMEAVAGGEADYAVLPIENSSAGAVTDNFDLLLRYPHSIVGEVDLRVEHALLARPGTHFSELRAVCSHPQALAQCAAFFEENPGLQRLSADNTAVAARLVAEGEDSHMAALASEEAAGLYGLTILRRGVNAHSANTTRFLIVGREPVYTAAAGKISLCFETAHKSGSLYNVLGNFIFNHVNMVMIQSRPIPERAFEYRFFVDIEGRLDQPAVINALTGLKEEVRMLRVLGCY